MKIIVFCRHGEANKNLKDIYGGKGSSLTEQGKLQISALAKDIEFLRNKYNKQIKLYLSCDREHVIDTSKILCAKLDIENINFDDRYRPIKLGVFDGLSRSEQEKLYPEAIEAHKLWENGIIDISVSEKLIPGMQNANEYYNQIKKFVDNLDEEHINILIGTRSDMSCLTNVFKNNSPENKFAYKYYPFTYGQAMIAIEKSDKTFDLFNGNKTKVSENIKGE